MRTSTTGELMVILICKIEKEEEMALFKQMLQYIADTFPEITSLLDVYKRQGLHYILISEKGCAAPDKEYLLELTDGLLPLDIHSFDKDALILENSQVDVYKRQIIFRFFLTIT